jgi:hypothetical protein
MSFIQENIMGLDTMARVVPLAALVAVGGCGALGTLGDIWTGGGGAPGAQQGVMTVEVQQVRQQDILVRTQDGQQGGVLYDQNTQVVYQNQQYPVTALERGDIVDMRVQEVQQGLYVDLIQVRTPVQDRQGQTSTSGAPAQEVYRLEGTIGAVDTSRSTFTLSMTQGGTLEVVIPAGAPAATRDRLRDFQTGDYVRVEVRPLDQQRAELVRFGWS